MNKWIKTYKYTNISNKKHFKDTDEDVLGIGVSTSVLVK